MEPINEKSRKVAALAGRLRVVQAQLADEKPEFRRGQLEHEIEQAVAQIVPQEREPFLNELMAAFPSMGGASEPARAARAGGAAAAPPPEAPKDPAVALVGYVEGLVKLWSQLDGDQRKAVLTRLAQGGVLPQVPTGPSALPESVGRDFRAKLQMGSHDVPDPVKVMELSAMMLDFVIGADRLVWGMWAKKVAPMSTVRPNGPIQRFLREYATKKFDPTQSASSGGAQVELKRLLEMSVAFISAIGQAGTSFGEKFLAQFSPGAIEESVGDSAFRSKDAECWKIYKNRAGVIDRTAIDVEITQCVARFVEDWMKRAWR